MSLDFNLGYKNDGHFTEVFSKNITHNLTEMASHAGIYEALWKPKENGFKKAKQIVLMLEQGLKKLTENPTEFEKFNAKNGWGIYKHFVPFVEDVLVACKEYPNALIEVIR